MCHCEVVRDSTIIQSILAGAITLAEIQESCGAAQQCGGCELAVVALLEQHRSPNAVGAAGGHSSSVATRPV
ncbi:MAG: (2Fe-2S)-binding protein [Actinomycetota bacterium]|nr:(2Fe-2S)-binding protein [Actinomycetota bacterium]